MHSIQIPNMHQCDILRFISKKADCFDLKSHFISIESNTLKTSVLSPGYGDYSVKYNDNIFTVSYKEEGKPIGDMPKYYTRLIIQHENKEILQDFVTAGLTYIEPTEENKIHVMTSCGKGYWDSNGSSYSQSFDEVYLPENDKNTLLSTINNFIENKQRYIKFGRIYKTSFLLTGVPGSGKTSIVKAISYKYDRQLYILNFTKSLTDEALISLFSDIHDDSILLLEDIDSYFIDRKPQDINISFSVLINCLDGVLAKGNGTIIFITANNPDRLDPALLRPGRIDKIIKFDYPKKKEIEKAFNSITEQDLSNEHSIREATIAFTKFYDVIKATRISMSGIIDYLFRHPNDYMDYIETELIQQTHYLHEITCEKSEKLYN
jgi:chaperone BCS1